MGSFGSKEIMKSTNYIALGLVAFAVCMDAAPAGEDIMPETEFGAEIEQNSNKNDMEIQLGCGDSGKYTQDRCNSMRSAGYCASGSEYYWHYSVECKKTCGLCPGGTPVADTRRRRRRRTYYRRRRSYYYRRRRL